MVHGMGMRQDDMKSHHQLLSLQLPEDLCVKVCSKVLKIKELPSLLFSRDKLGLL